VDVDVAILAFWDLELDSASNMELQLLVNDYGIMEGKENHTF
jgi:hypothetical protein